MTIEKKIPKLIDKHKEIYEQLERLSEDELHAFRHGCLEQAIYINEKPHFKNPIIKTYFILADYLAHPQFYEINKD